MNGKRLARLAGLLLAVFAAGGGVVPAAGADSPGSVSAPDAAMQPAPVEGAAPVGPTGLTPAARNMRFSLAEKRVAIEGRKKMIAELAARKAAQQPPAQ